MIDRVPLVMVIAMCASAATRPLCAQQTGEPPVLPPVEVRVTRETGRSPLELPFAISSTHPDSARPGQRHVSLDETLLLLPGVTAASRNNPSQDPRISIRGFGARSAFGVRGVRVVRDGMPLTLPDGQTPVDYLDLESVGRVDVLRGSASALYGNAAGGVIELRSEEPPRAPFAGSVRHWSASGDAQRWAAEAGGSTSALRYQASVAHSTADGWRDYSAHRTTHGHARFSSDVAGGTLSLQALLFDMPVADNPGALTLDELGTDREQADPASIRRRARKAATQAQLGLVGVRPMERGEVSASLYGGTRALDNPLPFAIVDIDRVSWGAMLRGSAQRTQFGREHRLSAGIELQSLEDDRRNFANCNGEPTPTAACPDLSEERGAIRLDQEERVRSIGVFLRDEVQVGGRWTVSAGLRADQIRFTVDDHLIDGTNPDDSGERTMAAVSPMAALLVRLGLLNSAYLTVSTSFETPTATELGNQPDGSAGINQELDPQRALTVEIGSKGVLAQVLRYDVALFETRVTDELVPFEIPGGGTRRYFRNAGRTVRRGAELGVGASFGRLDVGAAWSWFDFRFREYMDGAIDHSGHRIPGVPRQQLQGSATLRSARAWITSEAVLTGRIAANDANTVFVPGYELLHVRAGGDVPLGGVHVTPMIGVQNVFGRRYVGAVSINAANGRFYEPAPRRTVFAGLTIGWEP